MTNAVLLIDIGNTSTSLGIGCGKRILRTARIKTRASDAAAVRTAIRRIAHGGRLSGAVLCSVVPRLTPRWGRVLKEVCQVAPLIVGPTLKLGVRVRYPKPATIGADRLANASGAFDRYGAPVIVADFGTAVTFDIVSRDGAYVGGVIAPGLPLMTDYLAERTALLPHVHLTGSCGMIGKSTVEAIRIGAKIGYRGMVREITAGLIRELGGRGVRLCATGGFARWALDGSGLPYVLDPTLTLYGLCCIDELNPRATTR